MNHVGEFVTLHGSLLQFSQHGLKKYNDMTKDYSRATSHRGEAALCQIMEKQNRLEHLCDLGAQTAKCFIHNDLEMKVYQVQGRDALRGWNRPRRE